MKLSIITINFNNKAGLQKTIDSIVSQTWRDFEWIVVDGGSTDGSKELIEKYAQQGCFAWWCSEPDKGAYNAMNKGIAQAKGEYLNFMNSGDKFHENKTLEQIFLFKERHADILYGESKYIYDDREVVYSIEQPILLNRLILKNISHQAEFIKTTLLREKGYDESYKFFADWKKNIELLMKNSSYDNLDLVVCDYDTTGISSKITLETKQEKTRMLEEALPIPVLVMFEHLQVVEKELSLLKQDTIVSKVHSLCNHRRLFKRLFAILIWILDRMKK